MTGKIVATYDYTDEKGELLYQNVRFDPKDFRLRRRDSKGRWTWDLNRTRRVLYRLLELVQSLAQDFVAITEGEADADRLCSLGFTATTSGSATSWRPEFAKYFAGRLVCVFPDNDAPGRRYAKAVTDSLCPVAAEVRVIELPGLKESEDVSDWLNNGGTTEKLQAIIEQTKPFKPETSGIKLILKSMGDVQPESVEWFWPNKIPDGALTIISGDPGATKSYLCVFMAAHITTGTPWPDCADIPVKKGSVVFFSDEDHPAKIIRPRLDAHKADASKVYILDRVQGDGEKEFFDLTRHLSGLEDALKQILDCRMVVLDPVTAYLGTTNANSNAEVRRAITPLAALAADYGVTIIGINHHNKRQELSYMYRGLGSTAFVAQARSVWAVVVDKDDDKIRIFAPIKSNYCINPTGLKYRIIDGVVTFETDPWMGNIYDMTGKGSKKIDDAMDWLHEILPPGTSEASESIFEQGAEKGFNKKVLFRAKEELGIKASKVGFGRDGAWFWRSDDNDC